MYNLSEDKVLGSELVCKFPKDMMKQVNSVLNSLDNCNIKGMYGIKVTDNIYMLVFDIEEKLKILFRYNTNKGLSLDLATKKDELLLTIENIDSSDKINLVNSVISDTLSKHDLISDTKKVYKICQK